MKTANKIHLKPKAYEDLENIYQYSVLNFGKVKAIEYINDIDQVFTHLSQNECKGKNCDFIKTKLLKFNVNSHVVFFVYKQNTIEVIRVLHQKQDYSRHI